MNRIILFIVVLLIFIYTSIHIYCTYNFVENQNYKINSQSIDYNSLNEYKVVLVINPYIDYHWYKQDSEGEWSHKPGITPATNKEVLGINNNKIIYGDKITDPYSSAKKAGYTIIVGTFYITPNK